MPCSRSVSADSPCLSYFKNHQVGKFHLWTTSCVCPTEGGECKIGSGKLSVSLCTCVPVSFLPIGCLTRIWMKLWLSKERHSPSFHLPSHWNLSELQRQKSKFSLDSQEDGWKLEDWDLGEASERMWGLFLLPARVWEMFMGQGLSTWLQDPVVNPNLSAVIVERRGEKGKGRQ